jgi:tetratricopeptide (TPR) repeat protein
MTRTVTRTAFGVAAALLLMTTRVAADQDSIAAARDLYASAAYEDALAVLDRLPDSNRPADESRSIEQYRAFCLLALGRTAEAEHAIEAVVAREPMYHPASDVSPRVRATFSDVRRRVLPSIIQRQYAQAKAAYDRKQFGAAASAFGQMLDLMNDSDASPAVNQSPLADLRTLAMGFKDLSAIAAAPPPPVPVAPPLAAAPTPPPPPQEPRLFSLADASVVPPVVVRQELPTYPGQVPTLKQGMIEVVIDEAGNVEMATMRVPVSSAYDAMALAAARTWHYRPAMLNGSPVKFRKAVQVTVKPLGMR